MTELHYKTKSGNSAYCRAMSENETIEDLIERIRPIAIYMELREFEVSWDPEKPRIFIPV